MNDKDKIIDKIRKCLALAASANEHEAAAGMRQAQKLMELHRISDTDMLTSRVCETDALAGASRAPAAWEQGLATTAGVAFACRVIFNSGYRTGTWQFIGIGASAEIAQYAFSVLYRQLRRSRAVFIMTQCKRLKTVNKTRRADLFCHAWVNAVRRQMAAISERQEDTEAIDAYLALAYPSLKSLALRNRNDGRTLNEKDWDAVRAGAEAGQRARLNRGVAGASETHPQLEAS